MARLLTKVRVALMVDHHGNHLDERGDVTAKTIAVLGYQKRTLMLYIKRLQDANTLYQVKLARANADVKELRAILAELIDAHAAYMAEFNASTTASWTSPVPRMDGNVKRRHMDAWTAARKAVGR